MRLMLKIVAILVLLLAGTLAAMLWWNNRDVAAPGLEELKDRRSAAIQWLADHQPRNTDPLLRWMIQEAARLSNDPHLVTMAEQYRDRVRGNRRFNAWLPLFNLPRTQPLSANAVLGLPDYNIHVIYALDCNADLESLDIVREQFDAEFCPQHHPFSPACTTHQLLGAEFMRRNGCGATAATQALVEELVLDVERQLRRDPRLVDVYLQRMLMLTLTGNQHRIRNVWLRRFLDAQRDNGAWVNYQPLLPLGGSRSIAFTRSGIGIGTIRGSFHTTAQGVLLTSLLLEAAEN